MIKIGDGETSFFEDHRTELVEVMQNYDKKQREWLSQKPDFDYTQMNRPGFEEETAEFKDWVAIKPDRDADLDEVFKKYGWSLAAFRNNTL